MTSSSDDTSRRPEDRGQTDGPIAVDLDGLEGLAPPGWSQPDQLDQAVKTGPGEPGFEPAYGVGAALSGGGARAALFGLGMLMAMKDAGKAPQHVTSVSGGSITNMMLSQGYFSRPKDERPEWDDVTRETFDALRAGSLTNAWIALMALLLLFPILSVPAAVTVGGKAGWVISVATAIVWLVALSLRGQLIEAVMARRYLGRGWRARTLRDLHDVDSQQVFCCTDLVVGQPVYFSSTCAGFRRTQTRAGGGLPWTVRPLRDGALDVGRRYDAPDAPLSMILRATAGFPGIPPRLARWRYPLQLAPGEPVDPARVPSAVSLPAVAFLSDGGIWNNLATEPYLDGFMGQSYGDFDVLVADASGTLTPIRPGQLRVPGWSDLKALLRQAAIQNTNTVGPRRAAYDDDMFMELRAPGTLGFARSRLYCSVSVTDTPREIVSRFQTYFVDVPDQLRYAETGNGIPARYRATRDRVEELRTDRALWEVLQTQAAPPALVTPAGDALARYPTTLGRVPEATAVALVARGYANAAVTMYLCNLSRTIETPQGWLGRMLERR